LASQLQNFSLVVYYFLRGVRRWSGLDSKVFVLISHSLLGAASASYMVWYGLRKWNGNGTEMVRKWILRYEMDGKLSRYMDGVCGALQCVLCNDVRFHAWKKLGWEWVCVRVLLGLARAGRIGKCRDDGIHSCIAGVARIQ